jgi:putative hydrolases of HD superfamily
MSLSNLLKFTEFTHQFQQIRRKVLVNHEDRWENDSEHSFQTALIAWYIVDYYKLALDLNKVIQYALIHDLVETYAGDSPLFNAPELRANKVEREREALARIIAEFAIAAPSIVQSIQHYENKSDTESLFVYKVDKLVAPLNIYLDSGRSWKEQNIDFATMVAPKDSKFADDPTLNALWQELRTLIEVSDLLPTKH